MNNNIKLFIHNHLLLCIFIVLFIITLPKLVTQFMYDKKMNNELSNDYSYMDNCVKDLYMNNIDLFVKENNDYILKMDYMYDKCGVDSTSLYTKELDQCVGYIKLNDFNYNINIDYSHVCEMIDY